MEHYFKSDQPFKTNNVPAYPLHVPEKSKTTIAHQLHTDLNKVAKNFVNYIDLLHIQTIAQDRAKWKNLVTRIISAYERDINRRNDIKKTGKRTRTETTTTTIATQNQSRNKKKQKNE
jgi:septum formation inhibitor MinC